MSESGVSGARTARSSKGRQPSEEEASGARPAATPLRPYVPLELNFSPIGASFYQDSFRFRSAMRDDPGRLAAEGRLFAHDPMRGPLRRWSAPTEAPLRTSDPTLIGALRETRGPGDALAPDRPLEGVVGLPSLRPEPQPRLRDALARAEESRSDVATP